ncbi:hypothetical protein ACGFMM_04805 [Streptomyces sp. NPDC048604]|uniref:hypothetical protein n=1 Tax=Streptomyces sp. NPDC048604 TaxID=3365578 RepID=UPI00371A0C72
MRRRRRTPALALLLLSLAVTGCGTEVVGAGTPDRAELESRARAAQTRVEHVYVTESDGFELARQSVGVIGDDGFQAVYVGTKGEQLTLSVERRPFTEEDCAAGPDSCTKEGASWYRSSPDGHSYVRNDGGLRVQLTAPASMPKDALKAAADRAHRANDAELDAVLPENTASGGGAGGPVERGDLPPNGDGAPRNDVGASG